MCDRLNPSAPPLPRESGDGTRVNNRYSGSIRKARRARETEHLGGGLESHGRDESVGDVFGRTWVEVPLCEPGS